MSLIPGDLVFVRHDGAVVGRDWAPAHGIENTRLARREWEGEFSASLLEGYGLSLLDLEIDDKQVDQMFTSMARMPGQSAEDLAQTKELAAKKNIQPRPRP